MGSFSLLQHRMYREVQLYLAYSLIPFTFLNDYFMKANVGFDARGVLKLFDFGFAVSIEEDNPKALYDRCGTLR